MPQYENQPYEQPPYDPNMMGMGMPMPMPDGRIDNIVSQINPAKIINEFNHALKGEYFNEEKGIWEMNPSKRPLVNDACRGEIVSYLTGIMNNASTMGIISEKQLSFLMEQVIESVTRDFVYNLERYGFVPPGPGYAEGDYENKGIPDTAKMTKVSSMIYSIALLVYSRSLSGMESKKIFGSLSMTDHFGGMNQPQKQGWVSRMFGG